MNRTVLLYDPLPDRLVEYTFDGEFVGIPFVTSAENGFTGLLDNFNAFANAIYYDSETARLFAIGSGGELAIWEDLSRLPLHGDINVDDTVNFLDISPFISILSQGDFQVVEQGDVDFLDIAPFIAADCNEDGDVNFLDIAPFITTLSVQ